MSKKNVNFNKIRFKIIWLAALLLLHPASSATGFQSGRESAVVKAVRKVSAAVVNISSEYEVRKRVNPFSEFGLNPFFESFFKDFFEPGFERKYKRSSLGSGVIIDGKRGFILTNAHVLERTGKITVVLKDEREFNARIVGADPDSDLAVLKIESKKPLPAIKMGNSGDLMIGETVIAIGNPFGFSNTVTTGVISALNRSIRTDERVFQDFIQTDASINPGNSGGPLLNINGDLVGINTAIYAKAQGIGFAIPINKAKRIVSDLIRHGEVIPAWIGMTVQDIDEKLARYLKIPGVKGALVKEVAKRGPASRAGIRDGDIILAVGNRKVLSRQDYHLALKNFAAADTVSIKLRRNKKAITISVTATVFPLELAEDLAYKILGVVVENLSSSKRFNYHNSSAGGVVITELQRQSYLAQIGARPGDIIRQITELKIENTNDFKKAVVKYRTKSSVVMLLQREGQLYYITVKMNG